jgi:hypothetical protein
LTAWELPRLRRGAHGFLRSYAAQAWAHENEYGRWEITLPPDVAVLPGNMRFKEHARQEARRLETAQLYDLDAEITERAVHLGAAIYHGRHKEAVALAGSPRIAATLGIQPPAASGFLRWRDGIGYNGLGAPVVACHWGPAVGGSCCWLAWWADSDAMAAAYAAEAKAAGQHIDAGMVTRIFGPLWYDHQELLRSRRSGTRHGGGIPEPGPAAGSGTSGAEAGTPGLVLLYTTLATWWLLTSRDAVHLSQQPVPAGEQAADRAAGLRARPVTVAAAAGTA